MVILFGSLFIKLINHKFGKAEHCYCHTVKLYCYWYCFKAARVVGSLNFAASNLAESSQTNPNQVTALRKQLLRRRSTAVQDQLEGLRRRRQDE